MKKIIEEVRAMHPYKQSGNRESFSDYNQGWDDACDEIESRISEIEDFIRKHSYGNDYGEITIDAETLLDFITNPE